MLAGCVDDGANAPTIPAEVLDPQGPSADTRNNPIRSCSEAPPAWMAKPYRREERPHPLLEQSHRRKLRHYRTRPVLTCTTIYDRPK